ncbi:hypothetical protein Droror1_Dr00024470 [Drosera rotundifolia]
MAEVARKSSMGTVRLRVTSSYSEKRVTRNDLCLHKLVVDEDALLDGTKVGYYSHGKKLLSGYKRRLVHLSLDFMMDVQLVGSRSCTSNGVSLHELSVSLARTRNSSVEENDDLYGSCFEAGGPCVLY